MNSPAAKPGGDLPWEPEHTIQPANEKDAETYAIPGGYAGYMLGDAPATPTIPPPKPATVREPGAVRRSRKTNTGSDWLALAGFNLLVFVSSICVMTLELTASRLIAKHVGSSLYTWTSVIGVVLAGITVGNYLGGWLADRFDRGRTLAWMFLASSLSCASVLWMDRIVAGMDRPELLSWPAWILCVVAMVFLLPALLLGTTSPLVASMALARSSQTGRTVGNVYAWGAFGSIVGTFLTGFYLIDLWGTRSIVAMTSGVLAALAVIVASGRGVFRVAVVLGWLQTLGLLTLAAAATPATVATWAAIWGGIPRPGQAEEVTARKREDWRALGANLGTHLQEVGLLLNLRDDPVGMYVDESAYSYIHVADDYLDGSSVKSLRLDKLVHSYYDPNDPTALHYEYEQVYAAVTKCAIPPAKAPSTIHVPEFPGWEAVVSQLPSGASFEAATRTLSLGTVTSTTFDALLRLSTDAPYWRVVDELAALTRSPQWGGFASVALPQLPEGVDLPPDLQQRVRYDDSLKVLTAYEQITPELEQRLAGLSPQAAWRTGINALRKQTSPIDVLFIGGGGYIFPRWVAAEFPGAQRIDVAELDPAVYRAVQRELGLTLGEEARIRTTIGDARNFVVDRLRENRRLTAKSEPPILYDFIYGDAFNDFGVPWHLTTVEFTRDVATLLKPSGVFQANIIDIYPRTRIPAETTSEARVSYVGPLPKGLFASTPSGSGPLPAVRREFAPLVINRRGGSDHELLTTQSIPSTVETALLQLPAVDALWQTRIRELARQSRTERPLPVDLPSALLPEGGINGGWTPCRDPFAGVEARRLNEHEFVLALRGTASPELEKRLMNLEPSNPHWNSLIAGGVQRSQHTGQGRFLGRYVRTMTDVFPFVAVFSTSHSQPTDDRDTFVIVCAKQAVPLDGLANTGYWTGAAFAVFDKTQGSTPKYDGQMESLLMLAEGKVLTDDYAPVDTLLHEVFATQ